jgi:hypothetical protein
MSFQAPLTVAQAIDNIERNRYLLPGIQREFVWGHDQIERLFDSLLRGYPISSFLFWRVEGDAKKHHDYYKFIRTYRQKYKTHNEEINAGILNDFEAVLDGQQRLTALYIGLKGSYAYKRPRAWDTDTENAYPTRRLFLDLIEPTDPEEDGRKYNFRFLTGAEVESEPSRWFEVSKIMGLSKFYEFTKFMNSDRVIKSEYASEALSQLQSAIHGSPVINYYLETDPSLDKALNIFIRINSGGEPLSYSDLVMSIAVSAWKKAKAREVIHGLADDIMNLGFQINKDIILRQFLLLHSDDIRFKTTNFTKEIAEKVEGEWDVIRTAFIETFRLLKYLGFNNGTLTSKNAVLPIVYYVILRGNAASIVESKSESENRRIIAKWIHVILLNQTMATQSDRVLKVLRDAIRNMAGGNFPSAEAMSALDQINRRPKIDDEFIDHLLMVRKDDPMAFSILSLLSPSLGNEEWRFEKDHLHPRAGFTDENLRKVGVPNEEVPFCLDSANNDCIANLHLLAERENRSKQDLPLKEWVAVRAKDMSLSEVDIRSRSHIGSEMSLDLKDYKKFIAARREYLRGKLKVAL